MRVIIGLCSVCIVFWLVRSDSTLARLLDLFGVVNHRGGHNILFSVGLLRGLPREATRLGVSPYN